LKVSQDPSDGKLEAFIHGLVAEEFDGPEPSREVLAGLAAYVRALRPEACGGPERRVSLASRLALVEDAVELAARERGETRRLLLAAARSQLGALDERFAVKGGEPARAVLLQADRQLAAMRAGADGDRAWRQRWTGWKRQLLRLQRQSLFDRRRLRGALDS
jgi:hypothetical protein